MRAPDSPETRLKYSLLTPVPVFTLRSSLSLASLKLFKEYLAISGEVFINPFPVLPRHISEGNLMDTTTIDDIGHRMQWYGTAVQEIRDHASERSSFGRYRAGAPYFEQYPLRSVLASFKGEAALTGAPAEYERITHELKIVERMGGRACREELFRDLFCVYGSVPYDAMLSRTGNERYRGDHRFSDQGGDRHPSSGTAEGFFPDRYRTGGCLS